MGKRTYKITTSAITIRDACGSVSDVEELQQEMAEWRDNMESNGMENVPKFEEVSEAADTLENAWSELEPLGDELIEAMEGTRFADLLEESVQSSDMVPYKGRGYPRWMRLSNALSPIQTAVSHLESEVVAPEKGRKKDKEKAEEEATAILDVVQQISDALSELEQVSFPGMF